MESRVESIESRITIDESKLTDIAEKTAENSKGLQDLVGWQKSQNGTMFRLADMIDNIMHREIPDVKAETLRVEMRLKDSIEALRRSNNKILIALLSSLFLNAVMLLMKVCQE